MESTRSCVVITHPPGDAAGQRIDFLKDYVALPSNYGSAAYFSRPDIQAIYAMVAENLSTLDAQTGFTRQLAGRQVLLKPNLVTVYHCMGLQERDYPETTDPRLVDAVVAFLKRYSSNIIIVESSGRGMPTRGSFRVSGLDRLAHHHQVGLVALEEQVTVRYLLPQAKVQQEIIIPEIFSGVVSGEAFYISMPKMKTNLYTQVTLGFKNAMGTLPYNLRQRDHHFALDQKLVDILHLFKPDLTFIDGLVGGEGNCPAPVDPVDSRVLISGNNPVETDRVAARMMGFDPAKIPLIQRADEAGFGDPQVEIIGRQEVTPFRPADPSLLGARFHADFPNVRVLIGHRLSQAPRVETLEACNASLAQEMEMACRGGCLASIHFAFDMFLREGQKQDFPLVLVIGAGLEIQGERIHLDRQGKPYTAEQIERLEGRKLVVGSCGRPLAAHADRFVEGCMPFPNAPHAALHAVTGTTCTVLTPKNHHLLPLLAATLQMTAARKKLYRLGHRLDVPLAEGTALVEASCPSAPGQAVIPWPLPPLTSAEIRQACADENRALLATFQG